MFAERTHFDPAVGATDTIARLTHAMTIPDLLQLFAIPYVNIAKIDIEGAEARVLSSAAPLGWLRNASVVVTELHDHAASAFNMPHVSGPVVQMMRQRGFAVHHAGEYTYFVKEALAQHVQDTARGHLLLQHGAGDGRAV